MSARAITAAIALIVALTLVGCATIHFSNFASM